jgi:predicted short-subunit dehydrogenase-like oxidoreductase (DUF2520 family)
VTETVTAPPGETADSTALPARAHTPEVGSVAPGARAFPDGSGSMSTDPHWPATIAFVGAGRAGAALAVAVTAAGGDVVAIASRELGRAAALAALVGARQAPTALAAIRAADLTFLTVPDAAIAEVAASVAAGGTALRGRGVVHCAASLGIEALAALRPTGAAAGCLHPFQALAGVESAPLLRGAPMLIEADPALQAALLRLVGGLGGRPVELRPGSRALYHAAAVLAGNAPLALLAAAAELLVAAGLEQTDAEEALISLMEGALANARRVGPRAALTGPVERGDAATVAAHLAALAERPETDALYRAVSLELLRLAGAAGHGEMAALLEDRTTHPDRAPKGRTPIETAEAGGNREGEAGVRAERRLCAGGSSNAAEQRTRHASQGVPTSVPQRSTTPASPPTTEDPTCQ